MNSSEARERLDTIEKIVAASSRRLEAGGEFFVAWGIASGTVDTINQLILSGRLPYGALFVSAGAIVLALLYSIARYRHYRTHGDGMSLLQCEFLNVLWLSFGLAAVVDAVGFRLFAGWGQAAIWSVMAALVLLYIGMHGNRRAIVAGIVLVASIAAANFVSPYAGFILAAGMYGGYAGFGIAELQTRERE